MRTASSRLYVTGSDGFIGHHLVQHAARERRWAVSVMPPEMDVRDTAAVIADVERQQPDVIVHLAAASGAMVHPDRPDLVTAINTVGTVNLLTAAERIGVRRVVLASSVAVIETPPGTGQTAPRSLYGATKQFGDTAAALARRRGLDVISVRIGTVYGASRSTSDLFSAMTGQACSAGVIRFDPRGVEPLIEVRDAARALTEIADVNPGREDYDLATEMRTHEEIANALGKVLGCAVEPIAEIVDPADAASGWARAIDTVTVWSDLKLRPCVFLPEGTAHYLARLLPHRGAPTSADRRRLRLDGATPLSPPTTPS